MSRRILASAGLSALLLSTLPAATGSAAPLSDPPVFTSQRGALDLVMVAGAVPTTITSSVTTNAWVYEVCPRTSPMQNACPSGSAHPLGGVRLQLNPGDTLKIRLVNKLPPIPEAKHIADNPMLIGNPTNLHTHGLIVEPHRAEGPSDPYGDYVFVELRNPANPVPSAPPWPAAMPRHGHPDMDVAYGAVDYAIQIPANHPSGHFWFHPHIHGVALNQVTAGLSGVITIGSPAGHVRRRAMCQPGPLQQGPAPDAEGHADPAERCGQHPAGAGVLRRSPDRLAARRLPGRVRDAASPSHARGEEFGIQVWARAPPLSDHPIRRRPRIDRSPHWSIAAHNEASCLEG